MIDSSVGGAMTNKYYLYHRVSKKEQASSGEGIFRQQELTNNWIENENKRLILDGKEPYAEGGVYEDSGRSGFTDDNFKKGELGRLFKDVSRGRIRSGDIIVIELIDRFSRGKRKNVVKRFQNLLEHGIKVAFTKWNLVFEEDMDGVQGASAWMMFEIGLYLAHLESVQKSDRIRATNKLMKDKGYVTTAKTPIWLNRTLDRKGYEVVQENAEVIQRIYQLRMKGLGPQKILNSIGGVELKRYTYNTEEKLVVSSTNSPLCESTIKSYLANKAVIGVANGELKFEPIIDEKIFNAVQQKVVRNIGGGGKRKVFKNILSGIGFCKRCGYSMSYQDSTSTYGKVRSYLYCNGKRKRKQCDAKNIKYPLLESKVYEILSKLDYKDEESVDILSLEQQLKEIKDEVSSIRQNMIKFPNDQEFEKLYTERFSNQEDLELKLVEAKTSRSGDLSFLNVDYSRPEGKQQLNEIFKDYGIKVLVEDDIIEITVGAWNDFMIKGSLSSTVNPSAALNGKKYGSKGIDYDAKTSMERYMLDAPKEDVGSGVSSELGKQVLNLYPEIKDHILKGNKQ
ncbi:resolvase [Vibrio cyclitrophicus]|uniref:recombinase family protein n=1 Tax=Vibrio cyclitrophicus TaxID=47951 RepID=UPI000C837978|nr:recombinase family protein [Vibrio cyclitrophicus]NOH43314.1 resolvase [Vibrio cyclitrophicus]PMK01424.1 hypothetical protein BCU09_15925 [Vibrio cyclitrophicus]